MRKLLKVFILLCVIYFGILLIRSQFSTGHHISYMINTQNEKFEIEEIYQKNKNSQAEYFLQIRIHDVIFPIPISIKKEKRKLVEDVYYFENEKYVCIYPVGKNMGTMDVLCEQEGIIYPYQSMHGIDTEVDGFVMSL